MGIQRYVTSGVSSRSQEGLFRQTLQPRGLASKNRDRHGDYARTPAPAVRPDPIPAGAREMLESRPVASPEIIARKGRTAPVEGSAPNEQPHRRRGQPFRIVCQKDTANQIAARCNLPSGVGALVPYLPEREAFPGVERKEPERAEESLASEQAPDQPPPGVGDPKVGGGSSSEELQRQRRPADIGHGKDQRHRLAAVGAGRCLQAQTELRLLRRQLSEWSAHPDPGRRWPGG
jgi:hypothetical protein